MEYVLFMFLVQAPFLYLIWRAFNSHTAKIFVNLRMLESQIKKSQNLIDTLRFTQDKNLADLESDIEKIRSLYTLSNARLRELEKYTGLQSPSEEKPSITSKSILENKDFTL